MFNQSVILFNVEGKVELNLSHICNVLVVGNNDVDVEFPVVPVMMDD